MRLSCHRENFTPFKILKRDLRLEDIDFILEHGVLPVVTKHTEDTVSFIKRCCDDLLIKTPDADGC